MTSLSYQILPRAFLESVLMGLVPLVSAVELFDLWLMTPNGGTLPIQQRLQQVADLVMMQDVDEVMTLH